MDEPKATYRDHYVSGRPRQRDRGEAGGRGPAHRAHVRCEDRAGIRRLSDSNGQPGVSERQDFGYTWDVLGNLTRTHRHHRQRGT